MTEGFTTKFICKLWGNTVEDQSSLNQYIADSHHPKRIVAINDVINGVFEGTINFPKTKAEIVKAVEKIKDNENKPEITP